MDRGKQGTKRSVMTEGHGIPVGVVVAPANRHDSPLLEPTLERLSRFGFDLPGRCSGASYTRPTASRLRATSCARSPRTAATSPVMRRWPELLWLASIFHWLVEWGLVASLPVSWLGLCRLGVTACRVSSRGGRAFPGAGGFFLQDRGGQEAGAVCLTEPVGPESCSVRSAGGR